MKPLLEKNWIKIIAEPPFPWQMLCNMGILVFKTVTKSYKVSVSPEHIPTVACRFMFDTQFKYLLNRKDYLMQFYCYVSLFVQTKHLSQHVCSGI